MKHSNNSNKLLDKLVQDGILRINKTQKIETSRILNNFLRIVRRGDVKMYFNGDSKSFSKPTIMDGVYIPNRCGYARTKNVVDSLEDYGYIVRERGYRYSNKKRRDGVILISEAFRKILLDYVNGSDDSDDSDENRNVLIITSSTGDEYIEVKTGEKMLSGKTIKNVRKYNKFLGENTISHGDSVPMTLWLCRIFKDNMHQHGRIYNLYQKVNYQTMAKMDRKSIRINGKETVELDYKHMHPSILYAINGLEVLFDIYDIGADYEDYFDIYEEDEIQPNYKAMMRHLVKEAFLRMMNTQSRAVCVASMMRLIEKDEEKEEPFRDFLNIKENHYKLVNRLLDRIEAVHHPLAEEFYTEVSLTLMNHDSNILMRILDKCMDHEIVALPLHDSVIVEIENKDKVKEFMVEAYKEELGTSANCKVEEK